MVSAPFLPQHYSIDIIRKKQEQKKDVIHIKHRPYLQLAPSTPYIIRVYRVIRICPLGVAAPLGFLFYLSKTFPYQHPCFTIACNALISALIFNR